MIKYDHVLNKSKENFLELIMERVSRNENANLDKLSNMASFLARPLGKQLVGYEII